MFFIYFRMIWKKGLMVLPRLLLTVFVTAAVIGGAAFVVYHASGEEDTLPGVDVAIVTEGNDFSITMGTQLVQNMESVRSICRFHEVNEAEAAEGLKSGRFQAAAYLPENIYEDVDSGVNTPVRVQVSSQSLLSLRMFRDLVDAGLSIIQTGESAVYAIYDTAAEYGAEGSPGQIANDISARFMTLALQRDTVFHTTVISPFGEISIPVFYTVTILLFVTCILFGISFAELYKGENRAFRICLKRSGTGDAARAAARVTVVTLVLFLFLSLVYILLSFFSSLTVFNGTYLIILAVPAFSTAAFIHMIYSFTSGESGSLFYLLFSILVFIVGGGLFPSAMLPDMLKSVPRFLPVQTWQDCLSGVFMGSPSKSAVMSAAGAGLLMILAGLAAEKLTGEIK